MNYPYRANSPESQILLNSPEGQARMFWLALLKHHPEITEAEVERIIDLATPEETAAIRAVIYGKPEDNLDPKASTTATRTANAETDPSPTGKSSTT